MIMFMNIECEYTPHPHPPWNEKGTTTTFLKKHSQTFISDSLSNIRYCLNFRMETFSDISYWGKSIFGVYSQRTPPATISSEFPNIFT